MFPTRARARAGGSRVLLTRRFIQTRFFFLPRRQTWNKHGTNNATFKGSGIAEWSTNQKANTSFTGGLLDYKLDHINLTFVNWKISKCLNNGFTSLRNFHEYSDELYTNGANKIAISRDDRKYFNNISERVQMYTEWPSVTSLLVNMSIIPRLSCQITFKYRFHVKMSDAIAVTNSTNNRIWANSPTDASLRSFRQ